MHGLRQAVPAGQDALREVSHPIKLGVKKVLANQEGRVVRQVREGPARVEPSALRTVRHPRPVDRGGILPVDGPALPAPDRHGVVGEFVDGGLPAGRAEGVHVMMIWWSGR